MVDRNEQRRLIALAARSRPGGKPDPGEPWEFPVSAFLSALVLVGIATGCLFAISTFPKEWSRFAAALLMFQVSLSGAKAFHNTARKSGYHDVLVNLPISGKSALEWIRSLFFRKSILPILAMSALTGWFLQGFSTDDPAAIIATSVLMFAVTIATVALLDDPLICRLRIPLIWTSVLYIGAAGLFVLLIFRDSSLGLIASGDSTRKAVEMATWIFPASWVLPEHLHAGGWILAGAFFALGIWRWHRMPAEFGPSYDVPGDYLTAFGHFGIGEEWEDDFRTTPETEIQAVESEPETDAKPRAGKSARALELLQRAEGKGTLGAGWIERRLEKLLNPRERLITHAMHGEPLGHSYWVKKAVIFAPIFMVVSWFFVKVFPAPDTDSFAFVAGVLALPVILIAILFPYSNGIGTAISPTSVGSLIAPTFTSFPISVRELLRISLKITLVRGLVFILIASPLCYLHFTLLGIGWAARTCLPAAPVLVLLILAIRPIFFFYRLQEAAKPRKRFRMKHLAFVTFTIVLAPLLLAGLIVTGMGIYSWGTEGYGGGVGRWMLLFSSCGILACALASRVVFETYLWLIRRRNYDWLKESS